MSIPLATPTLLCTVLLLAACTQAPQKPLYNDEEPENPPVVLEEQSSISVRETKNVSYQGILEEVGITTAMQGSHRLTLPGGRFILLESETLDLNAYLGTEVEVFGAIRPTVEAGGIIMRVEQVLYLHESSSSEESTSSSISSVSQDTLESSSQVPLPKPLNPESQAKQSSAMQEAPPKPSSSSAQQQRSQEPEPIERDEAPVSEILQAHIDAMAKENISADRWSRQYCTSHIGFCIPIHKNWYFTSFGATTSSLWHVEISNEAIESLGDGPISVNLYSGTVASRKATDGQVRLQGDTVIGFREWTDGRHFEVIAPAVLEEAVRYITKNFSAAPAQ